MQKPAGAPQQPSPEAERGYALARVLGYQANYLRERFGFLDDANEWRRMFAELLGTFFLVIVAVGAGMVNARFGGHTIGPPAQVAAPGLMVGAIILFMGSVSGAHLNPARHAGVRAAPRLPLEARARYLVAQALGGVLAVRRAGRARAQAGNGGPHASRRRASARRRRCSGRCCSRRVS